MSIKEIHPTDMTDNVFQLIGGDWMLVSAERNEKINAMTASWGGFGVLWARPVAYIFIRPSRYTKEFVDGSEYMTLSVFEQKYKPMMQYFGTVSGRDEDKIAKSSLHVKRCSAYTYFEEARLTLLTKKLYAQPLEERFFTEPGMNAVPAKDDPRIHYPEHDYHTMYITEIERILTKE